MLNPLWFWWFVSCCVWFWCGRCLESNLETLGKTSDQSNSLSHTASLETPQTRSRLQLCSDADRVSTVHIQQGSHVAARCCNGDMEYVLRTMSNVAISAGYGNEGSDDVRRPFDDIVAVWFPIGRVGQGETQTIWSGRFVGNGESQCFWNVSRTNTDTREGFDEAMPRMLGQTMHHRNECSGRSIAGRREGTSGLLMLDNRIEGHSRMPGAARDGVEGPM